MKKLLRYLVRHEKAVLLWLPCLALALASVLLVPQIMQISAARKAGQIPISQSAEELTVVDAREIPDEVKAPQEIAPEEAIPEVIETPPPSPYGWKTDENGQRIYLREDGSLLRGLKYIDNKIYYFLENGVCATSVGADVSFYNGSVNWKALKKAGVDFVILRIGGRGWGQGGTLYDDWCFFSSLNSAKAAGLNVGAYFYSAATNLAEAAQEAVLAVDRLHGISLELPLFFDSEYSGNYPNGRSDPLSMAERTEIAKVFCRLVERAGYKAGIYASESFLKDELNFDALSEYQIWMANYTEDGRLPTPSHRFDIWQFTDRGRLPGISGNCDINVIF